MHARSRIAQAFLFAITCAARCLPQPSHDDELAAQKTVGQAMDRVNALDNEGGLALLAEALRMNPDNFQAHYWTAFILRQRAGSDPQAKSAAIGHLRQALRIMPEGEAAQAARRLLARLTGRPPGLTLVVDSSQMGGSSNATGTELVARTMCGETCLAFSSLLTAAVVKSISGGDGSPRADDMGHLRFAGGRAYPLSTLATDTARFTACVRELSGAASDGEPKCGWVAGLGPVYAQFPSLPVERLGLGGFATMPVTVVDPLDCSIVQTFDVGTASVQYAVATKLVSGIGDLIGGEFGGLLGGGGNEGAAVVTCLAMQTHHRLSRLTRRLREDELRDELTFPLNDPWGCWLRSCAKTPAEALSAPRVSIAPIFCPDAIASEVAPDIEDDVLSALLDGGACSVVSSRQFGRGIEALQNERKGLPLLRCHEQIARGVEADYLLLTWFDDFTSTVKSKNLIGSEALVRMKGHASVVDVRSGQPTVTRKFDFRADKSELVGDVAERYLIAREQVAANVVAEVVGAVTDAIGSKPQEG